MIRNGLRQVSCSFSFLFATALVFQLKRLESKPLFPSTLSLSQKGFMQVQWCVALIKKKKNNTTRFAAKLQLITAEVQELWEESQTGTWSCKFLKFCRKQVFLSGVDMHKKKST